MSIKYKLIRQNVPGEKGTGNYNYCVRACERNKVDLNEVARIITERSSFSRGDVVGVLTGLVDLIPELLLENKSIELGELGIFSLYLKSDTTKVPRVDSYRLIKSVKMQFRPGVKIKRALLFPDFTKSKTSEY